MFDEFEKNNTENTNNENFAGGAERNTDAGESFDIFSYVKKENSAQNDSSAQTVTNSQLFETQAGTEKSTQAIPAPEHVPERQPESPVQQSFIPTPPVIEEPADPVSYQTIPNEVPHTAAEPEFHQQTGASYMPRPQTVEHESASYAQTNKAKAFFKKNWMYITLGGVSLMLVITIVFNIVLVGMVFKNKLETGGTRQPQTNQGGQSLNISESPSTDTTLLPGSTEKLTFAQIATKVRPSVVSVITYDPTSFGQNSGQGSGIIYSSDGYIVTNAHVINNSKTVHVTVVLSDKREFEATILGFDTRTDLAVLKINATGLPAAEFGESDKLVAGDEVIAIGNPGGEQFAGSITNGIVSGVDRVIDANSSSTTAMKYIQTNAAINPGNSGGALVNVYGQVIGINTAKISATGYEGLGFAIPIATAKPVVDDLSSIGYVSGRVKIGITCSEVTSSMAQYYSVPTGLLIYSIEQDAELYGKAQVGDIIDKVDDKDISSLSEMQDIFAEKKVGDTVKLDIYRPATSRLQNATTFSVTIHLMEDKGDAGTPQASGF